MATALYRRYRPESFAEMIGQEHVTEPLMQALRTGRVNHAYLFSGPRGCGKTTSARILARCLNCEQGPTPTPCGECDSCVALARGGAGSVDVIEIDAASHGGVDDARDLRERASYGPAQSRYKIYIIDEAHMVTPQGFNALLKIVEEPPEHVKFVFATTEPEKVIGTIRSRTHHYPFRLVPPAKLSSYMQGLCDQEQVTVAPGVLSFVTRAGGGSVRDSLSVLDQLIAGSSEQGLTYDGAVSLLGFTDGELLDATIDALAARDGAATFRQIDKVIESGHDPRRFVEDLLERLRDLIIVAAVPEGAAQVLRGTPEDQLERMRGQQAAFGQGTLSRAADIVNAGLTEMTGANSPRLQLELICARMLLPASSGEQGYAARLDRLERRLDVEGVPSGERGQLVHRGTSGTSGTSGPSAPGAGQPPSTTSPGRMPQSAPPPDSRPGAPAVSAPNRTVTDFTPPRANVSAQPDRPSPAAGGMGGGGRSETVDRLVGSASSNERPAGHRAAGQVDRARDEAGTTPVAPPAESAGGSSVGGPPDAATVSGGMNTDAIRRAWPDVLGRISGMRRVTWTFVSQHAQVMAYDGRTLTLGIGTVGLTNTFRAGNHAEIVRQALIDELGVDAMVNAVPLPETPAAPEAAVAPETSQAPETAVAPESREGAQSPEAPDARAAVASDSSRSGPAGHHRGAVANENSWSAGPPGEAATGGGQPSPAGRRGESAPSAGTARGPGSPTSGSSPDRHPSWGAVSTPAPDWATAPPSSGGAQPTDSAAMGHSTDSAVGAGSAAEAGGTEVKSPVSRETPDSDRSSSDADRAVTAEPKARSGGASAVRESLAGARAGGGRAAPTKSPSIAADDAEDDSAVSDDDENIEVSTDVGRSVVERVLGGRVLSESNE